MQAAEHDRILAKLLIATPLDAVLLHDVRSCLQTGTPLGNDRFRLQIVQALGVRVGHSRRI
jgi:hypothetical protein